nr:MAG TPA: hypothetical protein [Bacteriophage sp.]
MFNVYFGRLGGKILSVFFAKNYTLYCTLYYTLQLKKGIFYRFPAVRYMFVLGLFWACISMGYYKHKNKKKLYF